MEKIEKKKFTQDGVRMRLLIDCLTDQNRYAFVVSFLFLVSTEKRKRSNKLRIIKVIKWNKVTEEFLFFFLETEIAI